MSGHQNGHHSNPQDEHEEKPESTEEFEGGTSKSVDNEAAPLDSAKDETTEEAEGGDEE